MSSSEFSSCDIDTLALNSTKKEDMITILFAGVVHGCSLLVPKDCYLECGLFDTNLLAVQDYDLWFKFIQKGYEFIRTKDYSVISRKHSGQDSNTKRPLMIKEERALYKKYTSVFLNIILRMDKNHFKFIKHRYNSLRMKILKRFLRILRLFYFKFG
jgi:hypothetical protein